MSRPINPEHLLEDELAEELIVRNIVDRGETGLAKLMLNLASEYSGVLQKPIALPSIRQASEMRACVNKLRELSDSIQEGIRESDDSKLSVLQSRYLHLQDRVNRLQPVAQNYDGIDKLVSDTSNLGALLSDALAAIASPPVMASQDIEKEGATSLGQHSEAEVLVASTAATPIMTTSIQPSNIPPPSYNSVFSTPGSTLQSDIHQTSNFDDIDINASQGVVNFDFVTPPNSDAGIIAAMQKQRQSASVSVSGLQTGKTTGTISKNGSSQFRKVTSSKANCSSQQKVQRLSFANPMGIPGRPIISKNQNAFVFPTQSSYPADLFTPQNSTYTNASSVSQQPATVVPPHPPQFTKTTSQAQGFQQQSHFRHGYPGGVSSQQYSYSSSQPQAQGFDAYHPQQQSHFGQGIPSTIPTQRSQYSSAPPQFQGFGQGGIPQQPPYPAYVPPQPQSYGHEFGTFGFNSFQQLAPPLQQDREMPVPNNQVPGRTGLMYQMGKWNLQFRGTASDFPVDEFLFRVETLARSSNIAECMLPFGMHYVLHGEAQNWYWVYHRDNPQADWITFKDAMRRHFSLVETQVEIREKISRRKQRMGEVFNEFYLSVAGIAARLNQRMPENELVEILRANMIPQLKNALLFQPTPTVAHLQECCKRCERLWQTESQSTNRQSRTTTSPRVNEITTPMADFPVGEHQIPPQLYYDDAHQYQYVGVDQIDALRKTEERKNFANRSDLMICWNCDEMGHTFDLCTVATRNVFCYGCGLKNTYKPTCARCNAGNPLRGGLNQGPIRPNQPQRTPNQILKH